jgi:hypothetical protein
MRSRTVTTCALLVCALLAACDDGEDRQGQDASATATPATDAQVLRLARVLASNFEHGGARFTAKLEVDGQPAVAAGRVNFRSGRGTALVSPADPALGPPRRFFWTRRAALAQTAPGSRRYVREVPDKQGDPIHAMIAFINLLSAETIDNTANIRDQAPRFIGKTTIGRKPVEEFRYGRSGDTTLWILTDSGLLRRISTNRVTGGLTVDLPSHEPVKIDLPPVARS